MKRPRIKDYIKSGDMWVHKDTKQNFEFDMSKYLNIVESNHQSQLEKVEVEKEEILQALKIAKSYCPTGMPVTYMVDRILAVANQKEDEG